MQTWQQFASSLPVIHANQGMFQLHTLQIMDAESGNIMVFNGKTVTQNTEFPSRDLSV